MTTLKQVLVALACLAATGPAVAETSAVLQVAAEGRADVDRNRLMTFNTMPDGREVLLALSCRADDYTLGAALDFDVDMQWDVAGEDVTVVRDKGEPAIHRFTTSEEFLALGGGEAASVFGPVLTADTVSFTVRDDLSASFDLTSVAERVARFRSLCQLEP